mmetsp:Transcript_12950/g.30719  ORF Transcript_12950/g.30719 Transcript_12950/m.30719 type:complete len:251 (+) Transcript_12950:699-1451(+)
MRVGSSPVGRRPSTTARSRYTPWRARRGPRQREASHGPAAEVSDRATQALRGHCPRRSTSTSTSTPASTAWRSGPIRAVVPSPAAAPAPPLPSRSTVPPRATASGGGGPPRNLSNTPRTRQEEPNFATARPPRILGGAQSKDCRDCPWEEPLGGPPRAFPRPRASAAPQTAEAPPVNLRSMGPRAAHRAPAQIRQRLRPPILWQGRGLWGALRLETAKVAALSPSRNASRSRDSGAQRSCSSAASEGALF